LRAAGSSWPPSSGAVRMRRVATKSAAYTELVSLGAVLLAVVAYTPGRILWVFAGSCALEGPWLLVTLAKRRRAALLA